MKNGEKTEYIGKKEKSGNTGVKLLIASLIIIPTIIVIIFIVLVVRFFIGVKDVARQNINTAEGIMSMANDTITKSSEMISNTSLDYNDINELKNKERESISQTMNELKETKKQFEESKKEIESEKKNIENQKAEIDNLNKESQEINEKVRKEVMKKFNMNK